MHTLTGKPSNNPLGRPKGSLNHVSGTIRQRITTFIEKHWDEVEDYWKKLQPKDKLLFIKELLPYASPRLQAASVDVMLDVSQLTDKDLDSIVQKLISHESEVIN